MGAHSLDRMLGGTLTQLQVKDEFRKWIEQDRHEYGTDPYNGQWNTFRDVTFPASPVFDTFRAAQEYTLEHSTKWENAVAVKYQHTTTTIKKQPTFNGQPGTQGRGAKSYALTYPRGGTSIFVGADQLTANQRMRLSDLYAKVAAAQKPAGEAMQRFDILVRNLSKEDIPLVVSELRTARTAHFKTRKVLANAEAALKTLDEQYAAKLYKTEDTTEVRWLICGWAAS